MKCRKAGPNLEEHVVGRHGELARVQHQALREQGEEAVAHHDLRFSPDQDVMEIRGQPVNITKIFFDDFDVRVRHSKPAELDFHLKHSSEVSV